MARLSKTDEGSAGVRRSLSRRNAIPRGPAPAMMAVWILLQLAALALAAGRVPLWAHFPQPGERLAVEMMLVVQVTAGTLLFPLMFRDEEATLATIAAAWPMLALAALLADANPIATARAGALVSVWFVGLALWRMAFPATAQHLILVAVAGLIALGAAACFYFSREFGGGPVQFPAALGGPIVSAIREMQALHRSDWVLPIFVAILGGISLAIVRSRRGF